MKIDTHLFLHSVGDSHKYQITTLILASLVWGFCDLVGLSLGLLEIRPLVKLEDGKITSLDYQICKSDVPYEFIPEQIAHSYVINYGIYCDPLLVSLIGILCFLGVLIGTLFIPGVVDKYGRKNPMALFVFCFGAIFIIYTLLPLNIYILYGFLFLQGICNIFSHYSSYILVSEIVNKNNRANYSTFILNSFTCFGIIYTIVLYYFQDLFLIKRIFGTLTITLSILIYFYVYESPRFLYVTEQYEALDEVFHQISVINKREDHYRHFKKKTQFLLSNLENDENLSPSSPTKSNSNFFKQQNGTLNYNSAYATDSSKKLQDYNFFSLFEEKQTKKVFLIMSFIWFTTSGIYYGSTVLIKVLPGNYYFASITLYSAEIISNIVTNYLIENHLLGRKGSYILLFLLSSITLIASFIWNESIIVISVILIILRFLINTIYNINYIYSAEIYPTVLRANGLSYNSIFGRSGIIINMLLIEILEMKYFIFCFLSCLICFGLSFFLKETYKVEIKDFIEKEEGEDDED